MELKLKPSKKDSILVACDRPDLAALAQRRKARVVLAAPFVLCSLQPLAHQPAYVVQPPRSAGNRFSLQRGESKQVHSAVSKEVIGALAKGGHKAVLGHEVALRFGQKLPKAEDHLLLAVFEGVQSCTALALVFRKGELFELSTLSLSPPNSGEHDTDVHLMAERLRSRFPQARAHWLGPMPQPATLDFKSAPANLWAIAPAHTLAGSGKPSFTRRFGAALLLVMVVAAASAASVWLPYERYQESVRQLSAESQALQGQFQFASERLQQLRARQAFFEISAREQRRLDHFEALLGVMARQPDTRVLQARMHAPSSEPGEQGLTGDFEVLIQVPREAGVTALAQSLPLLQQLSAQAQMSLRLATQDGHRDVGGSDTSFASQGMRQYRIQGDFPHAQ